MLKWLRNGLLPRLPKRYSLLSQLFLISTVIHCCIVLLFVCFNREQTIILTMHQYDRDLPIVLVPFVKSIPIKPQSGAKQTVSHPTASTIATNQGSKQKTATVFKQEPAKKAAQKAKAKPIQKKETKKTATLAKKVDTPVTKAKEIKKEIPKTPIKEIVPAADLAASNSHVVNQTANNLESSVDEQDVLYVGRDDYENLLLYQEAHEALAKEWTPPVGVPATTQCTVKVAVNEDGAVTTVDILHSSQILVYDSSARLALSKTVFPKSLHGKSVIITFNQ